jgi:serine/threonine protein kinase/ABC-type oligopeptide transport system substrate-binding subunit
VRPSKEVSTHVRSGQVLAGFRITDVVGTGATGTVFLATEISSGARVALKVLKPELADNERFRERFLRESRVAATLDHPHITKTLAAGEESGVLYLAMAYVEGSDLRELLRREGRLEPSSAIDLVAQVADALDAAHEAGLVHRDVKPGNILVSADADRTNAFVCDFGLARHATSASSLTGDRGFVGTIDYVSPEQIEGGSLDARADVYSLGCVLFESLAGVRPFDRESELSVVFAHLNDAPPRLTEALPELPAAFDDVMVRALAKAPGDRYASCGELAAAANDALRGKSSTRRRLVRRRVSVAASAVAIVAAATIAAVVATERGTSQPRPTPPLQLASNAVNLVSTKSRRVIGSVPLGRHASSPFAEIDSLVVGRKAWILDAADRRLLRVSLATGKLERTVKLPWSPTGRIAVGAGLVWVRQDGPGVVGIAENTGRIVRRFQIMGGNGIGIAFGAGSLWLAQGDAVVRVGPRSGRVIRRIVTRPGQENTLTWLVFADGALWSATADGVVRKFDPVANRVALHNTLHGWVSDLAVGSGDVWVSVTQDGAVYELSEDDLSLVGTRSAGVDPERISIGGGRLWIANTGNATVSSLSRIAGAYQSLHADARPQTADYADGTLLTAASALPTPLPPIKGEEILISTPRSELSGDPQAPTNVLDHEVDYATCVNLLGYPESNGSAGGTLQPEVAAAMPTVSADGRTYTFRVRSGFRFSPPSNEPVTAETFRRSIERALGRPFAGFSNSFLTGIVGEAAFLSGNAPHISGLVARGDRLRITLVKPSGSFLTRLSMPSLCPVPSTLGAKPAALGSDVASDGPYYVASVTSERTVLLRNPNYAGHRLRRPARIVFESGTQTPAAVALTDAGKLDYLPPDFDDTSLLSVTGPLDSRLGPGSPAARRGDERYLHEPVAAVDEVVLNAGRPLFRDIRLRRAVAYALDRTALARSYSDVPTDGIVPPAVPGFGLAHLYPLRPDVAKARSLTGAKRRNAVLYYCTNGPFGGAAQAHVADLIRKELARIDIAVSITTPPCKPDSRYDRHSRRADLVLASTFSPVPDPDQFFSALLSKQVLGGALGRGLWTTPSFVRRLRSAKVLRGSARVSAYRQLEDDVLRAAPVIAFGSFYAGHYFSPHVGCRILPVGADAFDLGALCKS